MNSALHLIPTDDSAEHVPADDCPCDPTPQIAFRDDGTTTWVVVHRSFDRCEHCEYREDQ